MVCVCVCVCDRNTHIQSLPTLQDLHEFSGIFPSRSSSSSSSSSWSLLRQAHHLSNRVHVHVVPFFSFFFLLLVSKQGVRPIRGTDGETYTQGFDNLADRCKKYYAQGARFCKWRAVLKIGEGFPSAISVKENCNGLARYAAISQVCVLLVLFVFLPSGSAMVLIMCVESTLASLSHTYTHTHTLSLSHSFSHRTAVWCRSWSLRSLRTEATPWRPA
jgi:Fructose-bisphosphate aldolase class-I